MALRKNSSRVLAIDPGYDRVGIAVMEKDLLIHSECYTPPKGRMEERLKDVYRRITALIQEHKPDALALETLFFSKNTKTALHVAEARGVLMLTAAQNGIELFEYSPQAVKIAVTGTGNAAKEGVIRMVDKLVPLEKRKRYDDEYDAIALAIAHTASVRMPR